MIDDGGRNDAIFCSVVAGLDAFGELVQKIMYRLIPMPEGLPGQRNKLIAGASRR